MGSLFPAAGPALSSPSGLKLRRAWWAASDEDRCPPVSVDRQGDGQGDGDGEGDGGGGIPIFLGGGCPFSPSISGGEKIS